MKKMNSWKKMMSLVTSLVLVFACLFAVPVRAVGLEENELNKEEETVEDKDIQREYLVNIQKVWHDGDNVDGLRPASVDLTLTASGGAHEDSSKTYTLTDSENENEKWKSGDWAIRYEDQTFTLTESEVPGYMTKITKEETTDEWGAPVENYVVENTALLQLSIEKVWVGDEGKEDKRPEVIKVEIYQNGTLYDTMEYAAPQYGGFIQVPKYDAEDKPYEYTIKEQAVEGYDSKVELKVATAEDLIAGGPSPRVGDLMFTITNTLKQEEAPKETPTKTMPKTAVGVSLAAIIGLAGSAAYMVRKRR